MLLELFHKVTQVIQWISCCLSNKQLRYPKASRPRGNSRILAERSVAHNLKAANINCIDSGCLFYSMHWEISACIACLVHTAVSPIASLEIRMYQRITSDTLCEQTFLHWQHLLLAHTISPDHCAVGAKGSSDNCQSHNKTPLGIFTQCYQNETHEQEK